MVKTAGFRNQKQQYRQAQALLLARAAQYAWQNASADTTASEFCELLRREFKRHHIRYSPAGKIDDWPVGCDSFICFGAILVQVSSDRTLAGTLKRQWKSNASQQQCMIIALKPELSIELLG